MRSSPVKTPKLLNFSKAMQAVVDGKRVTKLEWNNPNVVIYLLDFLYIKLGDGSSHTLTVSSGDMLGEDWVVVE